VAALLLSKTEKAYLANREQFSKRKQRDIRYRLNKKLRLLDQELMIGEENSGGVAELRDGLHLLLHTSSNSRRSSVVRISRRDSDYKNGKSNGGPAELRSRDFRAALPMQATLRFRRPPRYPDYATGPISMLNNEAPYINEIVIMNLACLPIAYMLQALRQMFCDHKESFVYRKYEEFQFIEFCNCTRCGKTLRHLFGFDEDIRG
jgi:hypothetical protein